MPGRTVTRRILRLARSALERALDAVENRLRPELPDEPRPTKRGLERMDPNAGMPIEDLMYSRHGGRRPMTDSERVWWEANGGLERLLKALAAEE